MLLSLKNLQKNYPGFSLDVSMEIEEGQITGLIGANGAGTVSYTHLFLILRSMWKLTPMSVSSAGFLVMWKSGEET